MNICLFVPWKVWESSKGNVCLEFGFVTGDGKEQEGRIIFGLTIFLSFWGKEGERLRCPVLNFSQLLFQVPQVQKKPMPLRQVSLEDQEFHKRLKAC